MSIEANKTLVRRWYDEVWNQGKLDVIHAIVSPDWANHNPALEPLMGIEGAKRLVGMYRAAFPDLRVELFEEDLIAEGDRVVARFAIAGTHHGAWLGHRATGKPVRIDFAAIFRVADGKLAHTWVAFDSHAVRQHLGAGAG